MNVDTELIERVRAFVEEECKKPSSKYGYEPYFAHFVPVVDYAKKLAEKMGADVEVVILAAWLHDIGSIIYGRENHHITGAEVAEKKLKELGYPDVKISMVKKCILNHRGSVETRRESSEEQILAEADAMSHFASIEGLFNAAMIHEGLNQLNAKESILNKLTNSYNKLSPIAKEIVKIKYDAVKELLG